MRASFETRGIDRVSSNELVASLSEMEHRPWADYKHGKPITQFQVGRLLAQFGISPVNLRIGGQVRKGYQREDFLDAFDRYLSPIQSATPLQT